MPSAIPQPDSSGGFTNAPDARLLTNEQRRSHQQGTSDDRGTPLDEPSQAMTKGTMTNDDDHPEEPTDNASKTINS